MEHCLRAAACIVLALSLVQAHPIHSFVDDILNTHLPSITEEVTCGQNVTFTSPTLKDQCWAPAVTTIMEQLLRAQDNCTDKTETIGNALQTLELYSTLSPLVQTNSTDCKWDLPEHQKPLPEFVEHAERLFRYLKSNKH